LPPPPEIIVLVYFNPHFADSETEAQSGELKGGYKSVNDAALILKEIIPFPLLGILSTRKGKYSFLKEQKNILIF